MTEPQPQGIYDGWIIDRNDYHPSRTRSHLVHASIKLAMDGVRPVNAYFTTTISGYNMMKGLLRRMPLPMKVRIRVRHRVNGDRMFVEHIILWDDPT